MWASGLIWVLVSIPLFELEAASSPLLMFGALLDSFVDFALAAVFHSLDDASLPAHLAVFSLEHYTLYQLGSSRSRGAQIEQSRRSEIERVAGYGMRRARLKNLDLFDCRET